ncbi:hypothetical protein ACLQ24_30815, partial [Micromonospora sp. DT4]|uniref:hypothetical protein n=1 Tax=Micromonospora sp. DT4 TaxID=3393438 RepID=UPI003CF0970F
QQRRQLLGTQTHLPRRATNHRHRPGTILPHTTQVTHRHPDRPTHRRMHHHRHTVTPTKKLKITHLRHI